MARDIFELLEFTKTTAIESSDGLVIPRVKFLGNRSVNVNDDGTSNTYPLASRKASLHLSSGCRRRWASQQRGEHRVRKGVAPVARRQMLKAKTIPLKKSLCRHKLCFEHANFTFKDHIHASGACGALGGSGALTGDISRLDS